MEDFLHRAITERTKVETCEGDKIDLVVTRTRTSAGFVSITLQYGNQKIEFTDDDYYESHALTASEMLKEIGRNACYLPAVKELT